MPVLNGGPYIGDQLTALAEQEYDGDWELVVVCDVKCRDRSVEIAQDWQERLPALRIVRSNTGLNCGRNAGLDAAQGDLLAFCDCDDVVSRGWLRALVAGAADADLVGGLLDPRSLNSRRALAWRPHEVPTDLFDGVDFLPYVAGGNCAIWTDVARRLRWDETFRFGSSDQEFSWRAHSAGYRLSFAPEAIVYLRFRHRLDALARQYFAYGVSGPLLYQQFRAHGMPRSPRQEALEAWRYIVRHAPDVVLGTQERRGRWLRVAAFRMGRLAGSIRRGVRYL